MGLLSSLFGRKSSEEKQTATREDKNFDTLKYDGIRARNIHQLPYAIKCFENAIRLKEEPETMMLLANAYLQTDATDNARTILDRLVEIQPERSENQLALARVCYLQADYKSMDTACQNAIKLDENNATAYYMAAQAFRGLQNPIQAIVMLTKATVLNENYLEAYLLRAEVLWDMRQANDSLEDIERVLSIHPENEDALLLKGKIQAALGDKDAAFKAFDQVLENNPFNENAYLLKGELDIELKELDAAIENYTEAIELMPENARLYQERGRARLLKGDKEGSIEDMKKAISLDPEKENLINGNFQNFEAPASPL